MIKALIFDIGGVIAYDVWENFLKDDYLTQVLKLDQKTVENTGARLWENFAHKKATVKSDWRDLEKEYWSQFIQELNLSMPVSDFIDITNHYIKPVDGMLELLSQLSSRGIKLGICSNNTEFWFERQWLKLQLYTYFNPAWVVLSSRVGVSKSSPNLEMFQAILSLLPVDRNHCIFIDDREENIQQALAMELTSILFPTHIHQPAVYLRSILTKMGVL